LSLSFNPRTFQHKIFRDLFINKQQRKEETTSKEAKPPRQQNIENIKVNTPPIDIVPSVWANKPTNDRE
jgi:hypothetical protein